jgi:membrane-associated phospholipid phosphatase
VARGERGRAALEVAPLGSLSLTRHAPNRLVRRTASLTITYLAVTALLIVLHGRAWPLWPWVVVAHAGVIAALTAMLRRGPLPRVVLVMIEWHPLALFPILYKEVEWLAPAIGDWRLTTSIPAIEAALFNGQPSLYLSERLTSVPLSEFLHFCYLAYVVLIPVVAGYWYIRRRRAFHELIWLLAIVMLGSYLFFILFPVDSPYYRSEHLGPPLEGHLFFTLVHAMSSRGGARGGAFPSAHVSGAVVVWLLARRHQPRLAGLLAPLILGLIVATVYGRFHYVLDTLAGVAVALTVVTLQGRLSSKDEEGVGRSLKRA